jgi:hypothetical protein
LVRGLVAARNTQLVLQRGLYDHHCGFARWFVDWWLLEILSWCFSAACMIIIPAVLSRYNGSMVPDWPLAISIEAFVSTFSGFAKSALLLPVAEALRYLSDLLNLVIKFVY